MMRVIPDITETCFLSEVFLYVIQIYLTLFIMAVKPVEKIYKQHVVLEYPPERKEGNVLFNDALNTFYLRLYGFGHMVKNHSASKRGNPLPPHCVLFPISSKCSFICIIPQTG